MSAPKRIQRKRTKGFRLPPNTVCVDRTSRYGNPFKVQRRGQFWDVLYPNLDGGWDIDRTYRGDDGEAEARALAVIEFEWHLDYGHIYFSDAEWDRIASADFVACFCDPDDGMACHGDPLIARALDR